MSKIIEVLITKRNKTYLATCDVFPGCQGIGNTQQQALEKLSGSIGNFIGNAAKETFKNTLTSVHYTEILLDQTQKKDQQKIAFNINGKGIGNPVSFLLKVPAFEEEGALENRGADEEAPDIMILDDEISGDALVASDVIDKSSQPTMLEQLIFQNKSVKDDPDSYVFGFPLNFN